MPQILAKWADTMLALLVILVWAVCFVLIKAGLREAPPVFSATLRALVAAVPLLLVATILGRLRAPRATWGWLVLLGLGNTTVGLAAMYLSVGRVGAAIPTVLANTQALLVAPFASVFFGEALTLQKMFGLLMGFGGVVLTVTPGSGSLGNLEGAVLALLASAGIAVGSVVVKHIGSRVNFLTATAWQYLLGSLPLLAWALVVEETGNITWTPAFLGGLLFLGLVGSAGASLVWFVLLQRGELTRLTAYTFLTPIFGLLLAVLLIGESLGGLGALGVGLTIAGVAWVERPSRGGR